MDRQGEGQPLTELRLGKFRKENLKYRLTDDPTAVHKLHGEAQDSSIVTPEERAIAEKVDYGIAFLKETLVFVLFLGCFVAAVFISSPPFEYDSVSSLRQIFVSPSSGQKFLSIVGSNDARAWLEGVLVPGLYAEKDGAGRDKGSYDRQFIRGGNRLIGPVRVRQVRSKGGCHVAWFGRTLRIPSSDCVGTPNDVNRMEDTRPFGSEYRVNGQGGYSLKEIDSLRALGFAANITAVPRFRYWTHDELCSEAHDPARETDMTVDSNARTVAKSNEGLRTFCMSGLGTTGELGVVYPQGGYVLDLPPTKWVAALRQYRIDKLLAASEWARKHGPFGSFVPRSRTATVSQTLVPPPPDAPLDEVNVTETAYTAAFENATLTQVTGSATVRPEATATLTSISLEFPKMPSRAEYSTAALHEMVCCFFLLFPRTSNAHRFTQFEHQWIDNKTSMVSTEFTVYNANTNIVIARYGRPHAVFFRTRSAPLTQPFCSRVFGYGAGVAFLPRSGVAPADERDAAGEISACNRADNRPVYLLLLGAGRVQNIRVLHDELAALPGVREAEDHDGASCKGHRLSELPPSLQPLHPALLP